MNRNTNIIRQQEMLDLFKSKQKDLDNHPAYIHCFEIDPTDPAIIIMTVEEGSPCSREMNSEFRKILGRNDFKVQRDEFCPYLHRMDHTYLIILKP